MKLELKFGIEQILSFCEEQIEQTIFPSSKNCSQKLSFFHLSILFSEGLFDEDMIYFTDVDCTSLFRKLLFIKIHLQRKQFDNLLALHCMGVIMLK